MTTRNDEWVSLWRSSAYEAVPYMDDFPECLLTLPELIDGAIAQGGATKIIVRIDLNKPITGGSTLTVQDNGEGISSEKRLLNWASPKNGDGATAIHHRYGHGSKKCLTKWAPDYNTAVWAVRFRRQDKRGVTGSLHIYTAPFRGPFDTPHIEDENDSVTLIPSGTQWTCNFEPTILGHYQNPETLYQGIKEILRTRYSEKYFAKTEFIVEIFDGGIEKRKGNSKTEGWKTFEQCLEEACAAGQVALCYNEEKHFNNGIMTFKYYKCIGDGRTKGQILPAQFPVLGQRGMKGSRIHIGLNGRFIEARYIYKFYGYNGNHPDYNGYHGFVNFEGDPVQMPTPCTTKVSFYENCPNFIQFTAMIGEILKQPVIVPVRVITPPVPQPPTPDEVLPVAAAPTPIAAQPTPVASQPTLVVAAQPTPVAAQPKISFKVTKKTINVLEGTKVIYKIPYVGDDQAWQDVCIEVLTTLGRTAFKTWCSAFVAANKF
jgi:hypothetical protein